MKTCYCGLDIKGSALYCLECIIKHTNDKNKYCTVCKLLLEWNKFGKHPRQLFELSSRCKSCASERQAATNASKTFIECQVGNCRYKTKLINNFECHMRTHDGRKPYLCQIDQCVYAAPTQGSLTKHQRAKHSEKDMICPYEGCAYTCSHKDYLAKHVNNQHKIDRPYECEICGYAAGQRSNLDTHMLTHTTLKPFVCDWPGCTYASAQKSALKPHYKSMHSDERPFVCGWDNCEKTFKLACHLQSHYVCHENLRLFRCLQLGCYFTANFRCHLNRHEKHAHSEEASIQRKLEETRMAEMLENAGIHYIREQRIDMKCGGNQENNFVRVDFLILVKGCVLLLEM